MADKYATGTVYLLPDGWNWKDIPEQRTKWGIDPAFVPLACAPGVVAWGTPKIGGYVIAEGF